MNQRSDLCSDKLGYPLGNVQQALGGACLVLREEGSQRCGFYNAVVAPQQSRESQRFMRGYSGEIAGTFRPFWNGGTLSYKLNVCASWCLVPWILQIMK